MANPPISIRVAQVLGITGAAFLSGSILSVSYIFIPALWDAPDSIMVRQWRTVFNQGKKVAPLFSLISTSSFGFLSYKLVKTLNQTKGEVYALAALTTVSIVPYTLVAMGSTNKSLLSKAAEADAQQTDTEDGISKEESENEESAKELVARWRLLNFVRGVLPLVGTSLGIYATFT